MLQRAVARLQRLGTSAFSAPNRCPRVSPGQHPRSVCAVTYESYGEPEDVLRLSEGDAADPDRNEVLVEWLAAAINPSDVNQIQGKYPIRPSLPAVAGNEGVGQVKSVGSQVTGLQPGDRVVAATPGLGTWCEAGVYEADKLHRVPAKLPLQAAACLAINPPTALRLLGDIVSLEEGDVIVQNGGNSTVGQLVIQIAASRKLRSINVVRERPELQELKDRLSELGATLVSTEASLRKDFKAANLPKPKLALNCVGGKASAAVAGLLENGGEMASYGGMSMQPVQVPTGSMIFKGIVARGFWLSGGNRRLEDIRKDLDYAAELFLNSTIRIGVDLHPLKEFRTALSAPKTGLLASKKVLLTEQGQRLIEKEQKRQLSA